MSDQSVQTTPWRPSAPTSGSWTSCTSSTYQDKNSVDRAWWEFFEDYQPGEARANGAATSRTGDRDAPAATTSAGRPRADGPPGAKPAARRPAPTRRREAGRRGRTARRRGAGHAAAKAPEPPSGRHGPGRPSQGERTAATPDPRDVARRKRHRPGQRGRGQARCAARSARVVTNMES